MYHEYGFGHEPLGADFEKIWDVNAPRMYSRKLILARLDGAFCVVCWRPIARKRDSYRVDGIYRLRRDPKHAGASFRLDCKRRIDVRSEQIPIRYRGGMPWAVYELRSRRWSLGLNNDRIC